MYHPVLTLAIFLIAWSAAMGWYLGRIVEPDRGGHVGLIAVLVVAIMLLLVGFW